MSDRQERLPRTPKGEGQAERLKILAQNYFIHSLPIMAKKIYIIVIPLLAMFVGCVPYPRYLSHRIAPPAVIAQKLILPDNESLMGTINYYIGTPYKYGGCSKKGIDCSCFVQKVYKESLGMDIPRTVAQQWKRGKYVKKDDLAFGDIVFFKTSKRKAPSHSGIYIGGRKFAHASSSLGVTITSLSDSYWSKRYIGARRMIAR